MLCCLFFVKPHENLMKARRWQLSQSELRFGGGGGNALWVILQIQFCTSRARKHDRGCTCTVIFISRPQLLHITTVGFHKAKARMNPPANSHRRTESVWGGWEPTGMQRWLRMQCTAIYIYIYIYRIYTKQQ